MSDGARPLFTRDFFLVSGVVFLAQVSAAAFFPFHEDLLSRGMTEQAAGFVIGVFSLAVLVVRIGVSPLLHGGNARRVWVAAVGATAAALLLYRAADGFLPLTFLRVGHGAAYAVLLTAVTARFVAGIPEGRSAEAFGWMSVILLVPYALVPPLFAPVERALGGFGPALAWLGVATLGALPLALLFRPVSAAGAPPAPTAAELRENLRSGPVRLDLLLSLVVWSAYGAVFAFLNGWGIGAGIANPGLFLTVSTAAEAGVRVAGGKLLDRVDKRKGLAVALAAISAGFVLLPRATGPAPFLGVAVVLGLSWGVAMPLLSGYLFDVSPPHLRPLNTNLGMAVFQAGFFVGPALGGPFLQTGGYPLLFGGCAALSAAGAAAAAFRPHPVPVPRRSP